MAKIPLKGWQLLFEENLWGEKSLHNLKLPRNTGKRFEDRREPWTYAHSRSAKRLYFFNKDTNESVFESPRDSAASFKSSLGTRYFWPWEADESEKGEENRVDRERLIEFFTTAQNNFLSGPPRKWVAVWLRTILPTVLYDLQLYFVSNLVIGLICIAAPSSRHYSQLRSTFHTGGHPRNVLVRVILIGWLGCCVSRDWLAKADTSMF